jgi:hypothetical protein
VKRILPTLCGLLIVPFYLCAQQFTPALQSEMSRIDGLAANPDVKLVVVAAMADTLQVHRNHLLLLRKDTGQSFAAIFVSELRARGMSDDTVIHTLRTLRRTVDRQLARDNVAPSASAPRPALLVGSAVDHNSAGTVYSLVPEIGFDSSHVAAVVGVPYYRISNTSVSAGGIGDVYVSAFLRGRAAGFDFGSSLTVGAPTGDKDKGLGAGKITADIAGTIARRFEFAKPWVSAGFANSVFNNAGYQRPYITDGNAAHFSGGVDFALPHKLAVGIGGFGLEPLGNQTVYSQTVLSSSSSNAASSSTSQTGGGMMPGGSMGPGMGNGGTTAMPPVSSMPFYDQAQHSTVSASELRDYGASLWVSIPLHSGISINTVVTRSLPFHLTAVRIGVGIDVAHLLFPGKHF